MSWSSSYHFSGPNEDDVIPEATSKSSAETESNPGQLIYLNRHVIRVTESYLSREKKHNMFNDRIIN